MRLAALLVVYPAVALAGPIATPAQPKLDDTAKAAIPDAGLWFAGRSRMGYVGGPFIIYHLTKDKLDEVYRDETSKIEAFVWLDPHTLVLETQTTGVTQLGFFVDGKPTKTVKVTIADWKLPKTMTLHPDSGPALAITKAGQIWLETCSVPAKEEGNVACTKKVALRVDTAPYVSAPKRPRDTLPERVAQLGDGDLPTPKPAKAPAGITVKLQQVMIGSDKVQGFACKGPSGDATWPHAVANFEADKALTKLKVRWVRTSPPIFAIDGVVLERAMGTGPDQWIPTSYTFHACKPDPVPEYQDLGGGLWADLAISADSFNGVWTVHLDNTPIAVLIGADRGFLMAPH
jgi:hypothetical protein